MLSVINNQTLCVQRDSSLTYTNLVKQRTASTCPKSCGPSSSTDYTFCIDASRTCPINGLVTSNSTQLSNALLGGWSASLIHNANMTSPVPKLWLAISQPCGNLAQPLIIRNVPIPPIYDNEGCSYTNADSTQTHTLFSPTSFQDVEYK